MVLSNPVGKRQNYFPTVSRDDHIGRRGYRKSILLKAAICDSVGKRLKIFPTQEDISSFGWKKGTKKPPFGAVDIKGYFIRELNFLE